MFSNYNQVFEIISEQTEKELTNFFKEHSRNDKDIWLGFTLTLDIDKQDLTELKFYKFRETPKQKASDDFKFGYASIEIERVYIDAGAIKVEIALNNYGFWKEEEYTIEMKAKSFVWHYQQAFEKMFLEMTGFNAE